MREFRSLAYWQTGAVSFLILFTKMCNYHQLFNCRNKKNRSKRSKCRRLQWIVYRIRMCSINSFSYFSLILSQQKVIYRNDTYKLPTNTSTIAIRSEMERKIKRREKWRFNCIVIVSTSQPTIKSDIVVNAAIVTTEKCENSSCAPVITLAIQTLFKRQYFIYRIYSTASLKCNWTYRVHTQSDNKQMHAFLAPHIWITILDIYSCVCMCIDYSTIAVIYHFDYWTYMYDRLAERRIRHILNSWLLISFVCRSYRRIHANN